MADQIDDLEKSIVEGGAKTPAVKKTAAKKAPAVKKAVAKAPPAVKKAATAAKSTPAKVQGPGEKLKKTAIDPALTANEPEAKVLSSAIVYEGKLFRVLQEEVKEPNGHTATKDIIRHNGSVVILAIDSSKSKKDPLVIMERQYRHAAGQFLWEVPAGKMELGEERLAGAKRELLEETGYTATAWTPLVRYFASPGFLGEWMQVFLAEGLTPGEAALEEDETLEVHAMPLSQVEDLIEAGEVMDGKTLIAVAMYKRLRKARRKAKKKGK